MTSAVLTRACPGRSSAAPVPDRRGARNGRLCRESCSTPPWVRAASARDCSGCAPGGFRRSRFVAHDETGRVDRHGAAVACRRRRRFRAAARPAGGRRRPALRRRRRRFDARSHFACESRRTRRDPARRRRAYYARFGFERRLAERLQMPGPGRTRPSRAGTARGRADGARPPARDRRAGRAAPARKISRAAWATRSGASRFCFASRSHGRAPTISANIPNAAGGRQATWRAGLSIGCNVPRIASNDR